MKITMDIFSLIDFTARQMSKTKM